jgi:DNA-binding CsgD family transcriptional regulator
MAAAQVTSPTFVGRRTELGQLQAAVERAIGGGPGPVLVAGEAGVGKTRLMDEFAAWARARGCRVLTGGCVSLSSEVAPFAPIIEALRPLTHDLPQPTLDAVLGSARGLGPLMPNQEPRGDQPEPTGISPDTAPGRLLELLFGALERLAALSPVVLVVEDVHWADRSTVDVLAFLARNLRAQPVLPVATFRTDEPQARGQLLPFIAELGRQPRAQRIDLPRLNRAEVAEQLSAILGMPVADAIVDSVYSRSEGNPFYSEELLLARSRAGAMPETLRDVLRARVAALRPAAQELARVASAAGRQFSEHLLTRVTSADNGMFRRALRELLDHQILVRERGAEDERLGFRHALIQELVYTDLLPSERTRTHAACARAIEKMTADRPDAGLASELAYHWQAAGEPELALRASLVAGIAAESAGARREAALQFERALELLDRVSPVPEIGSLLDRVTLLEHAAANQLENPSRAVEHIRTALDLTDPAGEPVRAGLLQAALGRYLWFTGDGAAALAACREAVRLVPEEPPSVERARVTAGLGQILMILTHSEEAVRASTEAVRLAAATGARAIESHALNTLGLLTAYNGDVDGGVAMLQRALNLAVDTASVDDIARAYLNLQDVLIVAAARFEEAAQVGMQAVDSTREPVVSGVWAAMVWTHVAWAQYLAGQWSEALTSLQRARLQPAGGVAEMQWELRTTQILIGRGEFEPAAQHLAQLADRLEDAADTQWIAPTAAARAEYAIWTGDPADALRSVADGLARVEASFGANVSRIGPMLALGVRAAAEVAERTRGRRAAATVEAARRQALEHLAMMQAIRDEIAARWPAHLRLADPFLALCQAEATRLEGRSDAATWGLASDLLHDLALPYAGAYARYREAEALLSARRDTARARAALRDAFVTARSLGAAPLRVAIEAVARRGRVDLGDDADDRQRSARPAGLTTREQEILRLVAGGLTNREISERLFITEKTASHHVSNVLAKLGVRGRAEAAVEAIRLGITPPAQ